MYPVNFPCERTDFFPHEYENQTTISEFGSDD